MSADARNAVAGVDVIVAGELSMPHAYVFRPPRGNRLTRLAAVLRPGAETLRAPCLAYAIRHPSAGTVLVDTGLHPDARQSLRRDFGALMGVMFRSLRPADRPFDAQLRVLGIEPGEVTRVVMTHLHVDHTSGMRLLPQARFVCSREEWAAATGPSAAAKGYVSHHLPSESRMELIDFAAAGEPHAGFSETVDLVGDGSIRLISTPGHTSGHLSVLLRLADASEVLLVGDAAYTVRSVREEILPFLTAEDEAYLRSLREIKAFSEHHPHATLVPSHDPTAWHALRDARAPERAHAGGA